MIHSDKPFGSIKETEIECKKQTNDGYYLIDNVGNCWQVTEETYMKVRVKEIGKPSKGYRKTKE